MPPPSLAPSWSPFGKRTWMKTVRRSKTTLRHPWWSTYLLVPPAGSSTNHGSCMAWRNGHERSTVCTGKPGRVATLTTCQSFGITRSRRQRRWRRPRSVNERVLGEFEDGNINPFYRHIKSLRMDNIELSPLKSTNTHVTSALGKATILLNKLSSVFTCEDAILIPWLGRARYKIGEVVAHEPGVRKLLLCLKPNKGSGPDQIPNRVLKKLAGELSPCFTALYNQLLTSGCIPKDWSRALISPVYKKGNVHEAGNYRPVYLSCKILEHIVCKHLLCHLECHNLLTTLQHSFRKVHSCDSPLLITLDDLCVTFDKKIYRRMSAFWTLSINQSFLYTGSETLLGLNA